MHNFENTSALHWLNFLEHFKQVERLLLIYSLVYLSSLAPPLNSDALQADVTELLSSL